jgi:Na+-transporting methylmalonyl-CoA/oxaloacetate decarboxylase gamma subunit
LETFCEQQSVTSKNFYQEENMYGLAAIQQANGWAMAGAGACIVLSGLSMLAFLISLIPRLTGLFEEKPKPPVDPVEQKPVPKRIAPERLPEDIKAAAAIIVELTDELGEAFSLVDLHCKCKEVGLANPHMSINRFRDAGILMSLGEGRFSWQPISE